MDILFRSPPVCRLFIFGRRAGRESEKTRAKPGMPVLTTASVFCMIIHRKSDADKETGDYETGFGYRTLRLRKGA